MPHRTKEVIILTSLKIGYALRLRQEDKTMTAPLLLHLSAEIASIVTSGRCSGGTQKLGIYDVRDGTTLLPQRREEGNILSSAVPLLRR